MENNAKLLESLLEKATEYGKTGFELIKLKTLDKTSEVASSFVPPSAVFVLLMSFMLFFNLGLAFWLGEILGKVCFGFFAVAAFYGFIAFVLHFFMRKWLKKMVSNYIIKKVLN